MRPLARLVAPFFTMPMDDVDRKNLQTSGLQRVMLDMYNAAMHDPTMGPLHRSGASLVINLGQHDFDTKDPKQIAVDLRELKAAYPGIDWVILGREPDAGIDMRYQDDKGLAPDWHLERAWRHQSRFSTLVAYCAKVGGIRLASPGWECRVKSEDSEAQPGERSWERICAPAYESKEVSAHARHIYGFEYTSSTDDLRIRFQLRAAKEPFHRGPVLLTEMGWDKGEPIDRMRQFIRALLFLERISLKHPHHLNRVALLSFFVGNGTPYDERGEAQWNPKYLMRDPRCWEELAAWAQG